MTVGPFCRKSQEWIAGYLLVSKPASCLFNSSISAWLHEWNLGSWSAVMHPSKSLAAHEPSIGGASAALTNRTMAAAIREDADQLPGLGYLLGQAPLRLLPTIPISQVARTETTIAKHLDSQLGSCSGSPRAGKRDRTRRGQFVSSSGPGTAAEELA